MNNYSRKRQVAHSPKNYLEPPSYVNDLTFVYAKTPTVEGQTNYKTRQHQRKIDNLSRREDRIYTLASKVARLGDKHRAETSSLNVDEYSQKVESFYDERIQRLEDDKLSLMRR